MKTQAERRIEVLQRKLKSRTRRDGTPLAGFSQNVAQIRAEIELLSIKDTDNG